MKGKEVDMEQEEREWRIAVRLTGDDKAALDKLVAYVRAQAGAGIRVEASDAVRWAIHAAVAACVHEVS